MTMKKYAIIVAGGTGSRLSSETPKQFLLLHGEPMLMHSIRNFYVYDPEIHIIVAMHPAFTDKWTSLCAESGFDIPHQLAPGGETRFHSVKNALALVTGPGLVAVHDAARPLATVNLIARTFSQAARQGSAIPCMPVNETVRSVNGEKITLLDRKTLRITQTPEAFDISLLQNAYLQSYREEFTDDGSVVEATGRQLHLVEGEPTNMKITLPGDIEVAEVLLKRIRQGAAE